MISEEELRQAFADDLLDPMKGYGQWCYEKGKAEAEQSAWHIVKWHEITDEERAIEEYPEEWVYFLDCIMPDDEEEILVVTKHRGNYYVDKDINMIDDGYYLDSGLDWRDDVIAWREIPKFDEGQIKEQNDEETNS